MGKHNRKHSSHKRKRKTRKKTFHRSPKSNKCVSVTAAGTICRNNMCYSSDRYCKIHFLQKLHNRMIDKEDTIQTMAAPVTKNGDVWIGSLASAQHRSFLERFGIKSILNVSGIEPLPHTKRMYADLGIKYHTFTEIDPETKEEKFMPDSKFDPSGTDGGFTKSDFFNYAKKAIKFQKNCPKPVLTHCQAGVNRSGSMIAAYMVCEKDLSFKKTIKLLEAANEKRGIRVLTNSEFRKTIEELANACSNEKYIKLGDLSCFGLAGRPLWCLSQPDL